MSIIESILIFIAIILIYAGIVFLLYKKGVLKKHNISFYGPALMWRTEKGIQFLKNRAKHERFWKIYGNTSIIFCFITMVLMTALMIMDRVVGVWIYPCAAKCVTWPRGCIGASWY